ncbi:UDP-N-acetylmuramate dehydrogenase [Candidatus Uhrbacteria bacterium]|nr:UDP-N-acetylmuramate dehydrogenase [Candidatus Uhrbacteria bacterium]
MMPLTEEKIAAYLERVPVCVRNESMAKRTSFRVGGLAKLHVTAPTSEALVAAISSALDLDIPFYVYGGGSNLLVSDDGYEGVMIQAANRGITVEENTVHAESGAITGMVARTSVDKGLTGFEWAVGVPGTIGGAVYGNAGCYGGEMKDAIETVEVYDYNLNIRKSFSNGECGFGYRESMFKHRPFLILSCVLRLAESADPAKGKERMDEIMRMRKEKQPLESSSAGCAFKNFEFDDESALDILKRSVEVPESMLKNKSISAGWLIDHAGMMGQSVGDAQVSTKHGNFFLNTGKATASEILALISRVKMKVRDEFGIELQEEVQYVGF